MPIKVPKVVTGKWIASLIHRSKLKWRTSSLYDNGAYCALGIIAKEAGIPTNVIKNASSNGGASVYHINDEAHSRKEVIQKFCEAGDQEFHIGEWFARLRKKVRP